MKESMIKGSDQRNIKMEEIYFLIKSNRQIIIWINNKTPIAPLTLSEIRPKD